MQNANAAGSSGSEQEAYDYFDMYRFICGENGCMEEFTSVGEHEVHYEEFHRNHCSRCGQRFSSNHSLEIHLEESHDPFFESLSKTKPMFRCYSEDCESKFMASGERDDHSAAAHGLMNHFDLDKRKRPVKASFTSSPSSTATNRSSVNQKPKSNVPRSVCFGGGTEKSFDLSALRRPWHQRNSQTTSENSPKPIKCADLAAALKSDLNEIDSKK